MRTIKAAVFAAVLALSVIGAMAQAPSGPAVSVQRGFQTLWNGTQTFIGAGGALATVGGTLTTSVTSVCTIADTNETDLWTYTMPANTLSANSRGVRVTAWMTTAANANTKTGKLYFGGTQITGGATAVSGASVRLTAEVLRTGASAQAYDAATISGNFASGTVQAASTLAVDTTATIIVKVTGTNGTGTANDICVKGVFVETIGSP